MRRWLPTLLMALPVAVEGSVPATVAPFTLPRIGEGTLSWSSLDDQVVLLHFWASWCTPCLDELPRLDALNARIARQGGAVLAVSVDRQLAPAEAVVRRLGLTLPVAWDGRGEVAARFAPESLPCSYLVDRSGQVVAHYPGALDVRGIAEIEARIAGLAP
jgi:thiol-disulfide isomerase/thioredoxin